MTGMEVLSTAEMKELWIAGIGRLGITGADSLSVPCHSEERSDEESCSEYGRCKGRRSFASLRMTGGGSAQDDRGRKRSGWQGEKALRMAEKKMLRMMGENAPDDGGKCSG